MPAAVGQTAAENRPLSPGGFTRQQPTCPKTIPPQHLLLFPPPGRLPPLLLVFPFKKIPLTLPPAPNKAPNPPTPPPD